MSKSMVKVIHTIKLLQMKNGTQNNGSPGVKCCSDDYNFLEEKKKQDRWNRKESRTPGKWLNAVVGLSR